MSDYKQQIIDDGFDAGLTLEEIFNKAIKYNNGMEPTGFLHAFVEYADSRFSCGTTGATLVRWEDLKNMPHRLSLSATRPQSFHVELIGFINTHGSNNGGWNETVRRWHLAQQQSLAEIEQEKTNALL